MSCRERSQRRGRSLIAIVLAVVGAVLLGLAIHGVVGSAGDPSSDHEQDLNGDPVVLEPGTVPDASTIRTMDAEEDTGARFRAPSVGLDVPLGELSMSDSTITPPGFRSAYRVRNLGVSPDQATEGTVFVAMHSLRGGGKGPGNFLIDVDRQESRVAPGDRIEVAGVPYDVTSTELVPKDRLGATASIWTDEPGRLVVITCLQRPDGSPSVDNLVVRARLTDD